MRRFYRYFWLLAAAAGASAQTPITVDAIWSARYVVTMDPQRRVIENGAVAITGDHIVAVAAKADIDRRYRAAQRLDRPDAILTPRPIKNPTHAGKSAFCGGGWER